MKFESINSKHFTFNKNKKIFFIDISTFKALDFNPFQQRNDEIGFAMESAKTGSVISFVLSVSVHGKYDFEKWVYVLASEDLYKFPELEGIKVFIYNT